MAALGVAAVGTGASIYQGQQAAAQQKKAAKAQAEQGDLQQAQQRRAAIRQSRIAYANAQNTANNQGVSDSSVAVGGQGSIESQLNGNLSFLDTMGGLSDIASDALGKAAEFQSSARIFGQVAGLGMAAYSNSDRISKVFSPKATPVGGVNSDGYTINTGTVF